MQEEKFLNLDEKLGSMLEELEKNINDMTMRSVMSDYCEDHEAAHLAQCLRWMVDSKKRPYQGKDVHCWFNANKIHEGLSDPESDVEESLYSLLEGGKEVANHRAYPSLRECEVALYKAWIKRAGNK